MFPRTTGVVVWMYEGGTTITRRIVNLRGTGHVSHCVNVGALTGGKDEQHSTWQDLIVCTNGQILFGFSRRQKKSETAAETG